jgi:NAD(P)-dependent dehydrogenase (short-subunit alcohol dehydrogenase family)
MKISLKNQVAIITGSSSGIGAGIAKSMSKSGATVVINYPFEGAKPMADDVLKEITDNGGKGIVYQCDVSKEDQVIKMFQDVVAELGTVDILVNKAEWLMKVFSKNSTENPIKITLQQLKTQFEEHFEDFELFWFSKPMQQLKENGVILSL